MKKIIKTKKRTRLDWNRLKTRFMTGKYKSLREFAQKEALSYCGNFLKKTKGWASERVAKRLQIGCKIIENQIENEIKKKMELNRKIEKISSLVLDATEEFFTNKDYQRFTFKQRKYPRDKNDKIILNKQGKAEKISFVDVVEAPFIRIEKIRHAIETVNKVSKIMQLCNIPCEFSQ